MGKKMEDRTPLSSYWNAIKSGNKALSGPLFKPDIMPAIKSYDQCINTYTNLMLEKAKLADLLKAFIKTAKDYGTKIQQHKDELEKILEKDNALVLKSNSEMEAFADDSDADVNKVAATLADLSSSSEDLVSSRKQLWDQISKLGEQKAQANRKLRDDYKVKSTAIASGMKKASDDVLKLESQIRGIISNYQKIAVQMDHDDIVEAVRGLLDRF